MNEHEQLQAWAGAWAALVQRWCERLGGDTATQALLGELAQALAEAREAGHVCLRLDDWAARDHPPRPLAGIRRTLLDSGVVGTPQAPAGRPLLLDEGHRLYLQRDFDHEQHLARRLVALSREPLPTPDADTVQMLRRVFALSGDDVEVDWQAAAAAQAMRGRLTIVSGGPGTGKTTTVARLLACLLTQQPDCRIALAAPTGKAAARLVESLKERTGDLPPALHEAMPHQAFTVHRLLGARPQGFEHDAENPLPIDALVVDEASMLDLALARRLFDAVPPHARVVLLGDKDQLAAVESGAVFADLSDSPQWSAEGWRSLAQLCGWAAPPPPIAVAARPLPAGAASLIDTTIWLQHSHRFGPDSSIARLAASVQQGEATAALGLLAASHDAALRWIDDGSRTLLPTTSATLHGAWAAYFDVVRRQADDPAAVLAAFARQRVLCAVRDGPRGMNAINAALEAEARARVGAAPGRWFIGQPVLVQRNDTLLRVFNGDTGIVLPGADGTLALHVAQADGATTAGTREIALSRLPEHETAFAMTIHKAQGSEFDRVLVLLPEQSSRVLSRELLYTALTRARSQVTLIAAAPVLRSAVEHASRRQGGLRARIGEAVRECLEARSGVEPD